MRYRILAASLTALITACSASGPAGAGPLSTGAALSEGEIATGGTMRTYDMYRPDRLKGPAPLVIMLHGGGGNGANGAKMSGFNALAGREGFVAVYPDGTGRTRFLTWNAGHCCAYAMEEDTADVRFISDLIDDLVAKGIADPARVYVTGMSNGAMMTHRIGRELPDKVAAIAPVVGAVFGDEAPAASPVPALIITGELDGNVPAAGGHGDIPGWRSAPNDLPYAPAGTALAYWMESNHCSGEAAVQQTPDYTLRQGTGCDAPALWYVVKDNGHAWPGGQKGYRRGDEPVDDFDASEVIWDFFSKQSRGR